MQKSLALLVSILLLMASAANAGVVMDLVSTNASGQETERSRVLTQSGKLRMEQLEADESEATMIFLGDRFLYIDHDRKSYVVMDEAMLDQVSVQMNEAMKQMEAELARLPPEQRAMVEQMMQGQMPGMGAEQAAPPPAPRVERMGSSEWKSYDCEKFAVFEGGEKTQEICAAGLGEVDGADELIETFQDMAAYMTKMTESMPMPSDEPMNPGKLMEEIGGFPVHTIDYENGVVVGETSLESVTEQDIDEGMFAAPDGYTRENPF